MRLVQETVRLLVKSTVKHVQEGEHFQLMLFIFSNLLSTSEGGAFGRGGGCAGRPGASLEPRDAAAADT